MNNPNLFKSLVSIFQLTAVFILLLQPAPASAHPHPSSSISQLSGSAGMASAHNAVLPKSTETAEKPCSSAKENRDTANSIIRLAQDIFSSSSVVSVVKIPNNSYDMVLLELQNRNAKVLHAGAKLPTQGKVIFQLVSESGDRAQVLYLD